MITDNTTYKGRTLGQWVEMAQRGEAEIVRLAGELYERCSGNDLPAAGAPDLRSAILGLKRYTQGANGEDTEGFDYYEAADIEAALASAAPVEAMRVPDAWMRKWAFDGEVPAKAKNANGRMAWPAKFKLHAVTKGKCFPDDVALYADARAIEARIMGGAK